MMFEYDDRKPYELTWFVITAGGARFPPTPDLRDYGDVGVSILLAQHLRIGSRHDQKRYSLKGKMAKSSKHMF